MKKRLRKRYGGRLGVSDGAIIEAIATAEVYGIDTGITDADTSDQVKQKLYNAGLLTKGNTNNETMKTDIWSFNSKILKDYKAKPEDFIGGSTEINEDDFWLWWYKNGGLNRIKERQQQYIIEQEKAKVQETPAGALWLYEESSPANIGKTYAGQTGNVRGVMDYSSGVPVYKLLIDVQTDKGKKTLEILSQENVTNSTGDVGRFIITRAGEVQLFPTQGETTSETTNG